MEGLTQTDVSVIRPRRAVSCGLLLCLPLAQQRQLDADALIPSIIQAGRGADKLLIDLPNVPYRRMLDRNAIGCIWPIVTLENVIVLIALRGHPAAVANQSANLPLAQLVCRPCRADNVLFHHHASHVIGAKEHGKLPHLGAHRHPTALQGCEVVEKETGDCERPQILLRPAIRTTRPRRTSSLVESSYGP